VKGSITLGAKASATAMAVSSDATRAVVVLDSKRIGVVDLVRLRLARRAKLAGATGAAFALTGPNAYIATNRRDGSRLIRLNTETGAVTRKIRLGKGLGGGVAMTTDGRRAIVGAARGSAVTAIVPRAPASSCASTPAAARACRPSPPTARASTSLTAVAAPSQSSARCRSSA